MDYTRANKLPGILLFIDFEKAFDSLEWTFLEKCLSQFGFGPHFTRWVNIFYKDIQSCITDNGLCYHYFNIEHGGPPFSLPFCLRCWNPSDCYSKPKRHQRNKNNELGTKLLQFADDRIRKSFVCIAGLFWQDFWTKTENRSNVNWFPLKLWNEPLGDKWKTCVKCLKIFITYDVLILVEKNFKQRLLRIAPIKGTYPRQQGGC